MPLYGQWLKRGFIGVLVGGSVLYGVNRLTRLEERVGAVEEKISAVVVNKDVIKNEYEDRVSSLEDAIKQIISEDKSQVRRLLNATVQVQISGDEGGAGSGAVFYSSKNNKGRYDNYVLSAAHLFSDDFGQPLPPTSTSISIIQYNDTVPHSLFNGELVVLSVERDMAVLRFESSARVPTVAVADESKLMWLLPATNLYSVHCPLMLPPVRTRGELFSKNNVVDGRKLWLTTAHGTIGASGGGVYLQSSNELIGVVVACPTIDVTWGKFPVDFQIPVDYLTEVSPLVGFRDWLEKENLGFLMKKH